MNDTGLPEAFAAASAAQVPVSMSFTPLSPKTPAVEFRGADSPPFGWLAAALSPVFLS